MLQVLPSWQKGGIGRGLMERLITELLHDGISAITLYAEPKVRCQLPVLSCIPSLMPAAHPDE